jgi:hypothetical protein
VLHVESGTWDDRLVVRALAPHVERIDHQMIVLGPCSLA